MARAAVARAASSDLHSELAFYGEMLDLHDHLPINVDLRSAQEDTMISALGSPRMPLTTVDQPDHASPLVVRLRQTRRLSSHLTATGIRPALDSLADALGRAFASEKASGHDLDGVLESAGMINIRLRKPTSGPPSAKISNHAWGTAIDFKLAGGNPLGNTASKIPRYIAALLPFLNAAGWFSGIAFNDTMHFEVADDVIRQWAKEGKLKP